ncbi:hypothetical protein ACO0K9_27620 [Undibacterium sp. Ji50W]|uniref:hypothetical protein n=1 Tax=Undibacterium sp. Ji50W TaxID=3413041 RepID=UPI003BF28CD3
MGLGISVGELAALAESDPEGVEWMEEGFAAANAVLTEAGLPEHVEPRQLPALDSRAQLDSLPYSFIHYLRRAYARRKADPSWIATPSPKDEEPEEDEALQAEYDAMNSHLICHSDAEGYYLPVDFSEVLFAESADSDLPGGMLGSSYRLMEELLLVAPALGIKLDNDQLSDSEAERISKVAQEEDGCYRELESWILLYECARLSLQYKTAIVFS